MEAKRGVPRAKRWAGRPFESRGQHVQGSDC